MRKVVHMFVDFSTIQDFYRCKRAFYARSIERLTTKVEKDESLTASFRGTLVHKCLDALHSGQDWRGTFVLDIAPGAAITDIPPTRSGSISHLMKLVTNYIDHYGGAQDKDFDVIGTEQTLQMPLSNRVTFQGTVDKIVKLRETGELAILDHKTSSSLKRYKLPEVAISDQFTGYLALAQANGIKTSKMIVDGISTALEALTTGQGLFIRFDTERTPEQITDFRTRMTLATNEMINFIETNELFAETISLPTPGCNAFNETCQFHDLCSAYGTTRANMLKNSFVPASSTWKNFSVVWEKS